jgi:hypothetical protein
MLRVLRFDANGIETEGGWPADGAVQRTKETQMRKFWRWVSALQNGEQFVNRISGPDWNCSVAWLWDLLWDLQGFSLTDGTSDPHQPYASLQPTNLSLQGQQTPDFHVSCANETLSPTIYNFTSVSSTAKLHSRQRQI